MEISLLLLFLLSTLLFAGALPRALGLSTPKVTLPDGWVLQKEIPYPGNVGLYDNRADSLVYLAGDNSTFVMINYESELGNTYSEDSLKDRAVAILQSYQNASEFTYSTATVANETAGYAQNYYPEYNNYFLEIAFVKSNYFFNIFVGYSGNSPYADQAVSLINSIEIKQSQGLPLEIYIVGALAAISALIIALIVRTLKNL